MESQSGEGASTAGPVAGPPDGTAGGQEVTGGQDVAGGGGQKVAGGDGATPEELSAELTKVEAERDAAVAALDKRQIRRQRGSWFRRGIVGFLVVLFSILLPMTFTTTWAHNLVVNDAGWNGTIGPLASHPVVTAAAAAEITDQIYAAVNPQQQLASALPPRVSFLAAPLATAAKGYVQQAVTRVLQSSQFQALWRHSTAFTHRELINVLEGKGNATTVTDGQVVLNLVPVLDQALQSLQGYVSGIVGHQVNLPTISDNEIPASACQRIANAIGRPVPSNCGQIALFPADKLTLARHWYRVFNRSVLLLVILTPVVAALALWLSRRRRRTTLQLAVGGILGLVISRRLVIYLQNTLANTGKTANKAARQDILTQIFHEYFSASRWVLVGLVIVIVVALVTGPYAWAKAFRRHARHGAVVAGEVASNIAGGARDERTLAWVNSHADWLRVGGIAVAVVILLAASVSWLGLLIVAALLALYEIGVQRLVQRARQANPSDQPPDGGAASEPPAASPGAPAAPTGSAPAA